MKMKKKTQEVLKTLTELTNPETPTESFPHDTRKQICKKINELRKLVPLQCPHCKNEKVHSKGRYRGGFRYSCPHCGKSFNDLTGTAFHAIRKLDQMVEFMETDFLNGTAVRKVGARMGLDHRTIFFWRHKVDTAILNLAPNLPDDFISVIETRCKISLKGSRHESGTTYADKEVEIWKLHGATHMAGICATDNNNHTRMLCLNTGRSLDELFGKLILKRWVREGKRVVVEKLSVMSGEVGRGKRRVVEAVGREGAHCERWKNLERAKDCHDVALIWGMKFHGVAMKYLNHYYAIISWYLEHRHEKNWFDNLLTSVLLNHDAAKSYRKIKKLKVE